VAPADPIYDQAGTFGGPADALPRFKGILATEWTYGPFATTARVNYTRGWYDGGNTADPLNGGCFFSANQLLDPDCRVKPWTTMDLGLVYTGVKNTRSGARAQHRTGGAVRRQHFPHHATGFNAQFHNALGRYWTATASYKFR
jgi:hypothetical protein